MKLTTVLALLLTLLASTAPRMGANSIHPEPAPNFDPSFIWLDYDLAHMTYPQAVALVLSLEEEADDNEYVTLIQYLSYSVEANYLAHAQGLRAMSSYIRAKINYYPDTVRPTTDDTGVGP